MNKILLSAAILLLVTIGANAQKESNPGGCTNDIVINKNYSKGSSLQSIMDNYTGKGVPGSSLAVYSGTEGWWAGASSYSKLETKTPMTICNLQYLQSVAKTYMVAAVLKLHEDGRIQLDVPFTKYFPPKYSQYIQNAGKITVRMLLNHTSGIPEYNSNPKYTGYVILNPTKVFPIEEVFEFLKDEEPQFAPGSKYRYTNTNFLILAMIVDIITGDNGKYIRENIFQPLQLNNSFYDPKRKSMIYPLLTDSYWDVINEGRPANISPMQQANVAPLKGDDGIVATPLDAVKFLKGLMEGKLLNDTSMKMMQQWVNNDGGKPAYGLGLIHFDIEGIIGYGHGGGGLGAGCVLLYVPSKKIYLFLAVNLGVLIEGPLVKKVDEMKNEILATLLF
jgi:D-alanyl-D-alanine carboxypeptidase